MDLVCCDMSFLSPLGLNQNNCEHNKMKANNYMNTKEKFNHKLGHLCESFGDDSLLSLIPYNIGIRACMLTHVMCKLSWYNYTACIEPMVAIPNEKNDIQIFMQWLRLENLHLKDIIQLCPMRGPLRPNVIHYKLLFPFHIANKHIHAPSHAPHITLQQPRGWTFD